MHVIYLPRFEWKFILIINCARYSVTCVGNRLLNKGKQSSYIYHDRVYYIYLNSWCTIKTTILQSGLFLSDDWCLLSLIQPLSPLDPRRPLHMLYIYIMTFNCPQGILGLGWGVGKHLKQTERHQIHLFNDKHHNFKYISYACAVGILQSFGNEGHL